MTETYENSFQAQLKYCLLFNYDKQPEEIIDLVDSISVQYDLFKNAITCEIQITDSVGFLENFPIIGDEILAVEFKTPDLDLDNVQKFAKSLYYVFNIYRIENREQTANRVFTYTLHGISSEGINNYRYSVNRTYYDMKAEHIAQDIFDNYLKPTQEEFGIVKRVIGTKAETKPFNFLATNDKKLCLTFSNENPLRAIQRVCLEAEDADNTSNKILTKYNNNVLNKSPDAPSTNTRITSPLGTTRGMRNNNPGNIKASKAITKKCGYLDADGDFAIFESPEDGIRAMDDLLTTYSEKYNVNTISGIINRWAPPIENQTNQYVNFVAKEVGIDANAIIPSDAKDIRAKIIKAITIQENGRTQADLLDDYITPALQGQTISDTTSIIDDSIASVITQPANKPYSVLVPVEEGQKTKSSNFLFYENDDGWNFKTIDHLLSRDRTLVEAGGKVQDFYFVDSRVDPQETESIFGKVIRVDQKITELNFVKQMNNSENMQKGLYSSTLVSLDPLTKRIEMDPFVYDEDYRDIAHLEKDLDNLKRPGIFSENSLYSKEKVKNLKTKNNEYLHKNYIITNLGKEYIESDGPFKSARSRDHQLRNPKNFHTFLKYDYASKVQFNNIIITFTIPGNSDLQIGDTINLNIPTNDGTNDGKNRITKNRLFGNDQYGGYFLVTRVNHTILTANRSYTTRVECVKDIYATTIKSAPEGGEIG